MYQWTRKVKGDIVQKSKNVWLGCVFVASQFGSCPHIAMNWCLSPVSTGPHWWYFTANATEEGLLEALKNRRMYLCLCEVQTPDSSNTSQNTLFVNHIYMGFVYLEMVSASKTHMSSLSTDGRKSSEHQLIDGKNWQISREVQNSENVWSDKLPFDWCKMVQDFFHQQHGTKTNLKETPSVLVLLIYIYVLIYMKASIQRSVYIQTLYKPWKNNFSDEPLISMTQVAVVMFGLRGDIRAWPFMR